jgi:hypothetical protein
LQTEIIMIFRKMAVSFFVSLAVFFFLFHYVYRPWQLTWGATENEVFRRMPGDEIVSDPTFNATRAITINAAPEHIWPWIVQIGYEKAGFYSYDFLDNNRIPSAEEIIPEYQDLEVGDLIPMSRNSYARVEVLEQNRYLLLVFLSITDATWSWGLYQTEPQRTRLVTRLRVHSRSLTGRFVMDAFEIIMMRKCLLGIKRRAETLAYQARDSHNQDMYARSFHAFQSGL